MALGQRLNTPSLLVPAERVHVLTEEEFNEKLTETAHAKTVFGHAYVPHVSSPLRFTQLLTHEMCHAASRYGLGVEPSTEVGRVRAWERKTGLSFQPKPGEDADVYFNGLNEGTTELAARQVRKVVSKDFVNEWEEADQQALKRFVEYRPWVVLVDALARKIAIAEGVSPKSVHDDLLRDYFGASSDFLKRLNRTLPGAVRILRTAGSAPEDAVEAASVLGLEEARAAMLKQRA